MIPMRTLNRRKMLRGMLGGGAVTLGVPSLDCFLNTNGTAQASGAPLPLRFGTWIQQLGMNPGFWEPTTVGPKYEMRDQMRQLAPFRDKINVISGTRVFLDGHAPKVHHTGLQVCVGG